jgi:tetratricopeptide (TPR) repeat protein
MSAPNIDQLLEIAAQAFKSNHLALAESTLSQILQIHSNHSRANEFMAYLHGRNGNMQLAQKFLVQACKQNDCSAIALYELGSLNLDNSNLEEAEFYFLRSLEKAGEFFEALHDLGMTKARLGDLKGSLAAFTKALNIKKDSPQLFYNLGRLYDELGKRQLAIDYYNFAIELEPNFAEAWCNKGTVLNNLKKIDEALICFEKALLLNPSISFVLGDVAFLSMKKCKWVKINDYKAELVSKIQQNQRVSTPFPMLALTDDASIQKQCAEIYIQDKFPTNTSLGPITSRTKQNKIRVGYFSADFGEHPVSFLTAELFELHNVDKFEIVAFHFGSCDESPMRKRLENIFTQFIDVNGLSDRDIAKISRDMNIDIAIDLGGHTSNSRPGIFSYRAAPIQVNYLGYAGTLGASYMDYLISDKTTIPEKHQSFYAEKIAYLPHTFMVDDSKRKVADRVFSRQEFSLPEDAFIYCCFNNDYKFNRETLESWAKILLTVEDSVLWLPENHSDFRVNISSEFQKLGIKPHRIIFANKVDSMAEHLARYALADLFLDTHPYNAHTTAVDSLKAGIPVITRLGESFASRVAASLLNAIKLPELITSSLTEYEALAVELARNPQKLLELKRRLADNRLKTPLFNTQMFTKHLEAAYTEMMRRHLTGLCPEQIEISAN